MLRLAWIRRLLFRESNWHIPKYYRDILIPFDESKTLYNCDQGNDTILFNNKEILVDGKPLLSNLEYDSCVLEEQGTGLRANCDLQ